MVFLLWLKDIKVHVEDQYLMQIQAEQLIKEFTAENAHDKVEFYMELLWRRNKHSNALLTI